MQKKTRQMPTPPFKIEEITPNTWQIDIDINPRSLPTAQQKGERIVKTPKGSFVHHYTKSKVAKSQEMLSRVFRSSGLAGKFTETDALCVSITLYYPWPSGTPKKRCETTVPMTTRPDVDNVAKGILDAMTATGVWHDDSQVSMLALAKFRNPTPQVIVEVSNIGATNNN